MTPDVIVIGGGPAGLAVAIAAARRGIATLLVESRPFPIDKPCGEGLLPNAVEALCRLGVSTEDLKRSGRIIKGIRYFSSGGRMAEATFPDSPGIGLRRTALSALLVARARVEPSLDIRIGTAAGVELGSDGRPVVTIGSARLQPRLVVAADGLTSRVRDACGIRTDLAPMRRWGVRQHFDGGPWTDHVEVYFAPGLEAYVTPVDDGVNVAWLWTAGAVDVRGGEAVAETFVRRIPALARRLSGRRATDRAQAAGPFRRHLRERARDGLLFVGDAAGYLDPITGEGVGLALAQAAVFEQLVVPLLSGAGGDLTPARDLERYLAEVDRAARPNAQLTRLMLTLARHSSAAEGVIAILGRSPRLFRHLLEVNMGRRGLWSARPQNQK